MTQDEPEPGCGALAQHERTGSESLAGPADAEARRLLVAQAARFAADFLHWMDGQAGDGISYQRLRLLEALHCRGPAIMRDLGDQLGVSARHMTAIVDGLEHARLVIRRPHPADRRPRWWNCLRTVPVRPSVRLRRGWTHSPTCSCS